MLVLVLTFAAGAFVGWNFPQPEWAKRIQTEVTNWFNK